MGDGILTFVPTPTSFVLTKYAPSFAPIVKQGAGRTGTTIEMAGEGYVTGGTPAQLAANIANAALVFSASGINVAVLGLNDAPLFQVAASACSDGGPHLSCQVKDVADNPLRQTLTFKLTASVVGASLGPGGNTPTPLLDSYRETAVTNPQRLKTLTRQGSVTGSGAYAYLSSQLVPQYQAMFAGQNGWVVNFRVDQAGGGNDLSANYTITAQQLASPLPAGGGVTAVDGEVTRRFERDEQQRLTATYTFDLQLDGDPDALYAYLRNQVLGYDLAGGGDGDAQLVSESRQVTLIKATRLQATFRRVAGADGTRLLAWTQTLKILEPDTSWDVKTFPGADPILVQQPRGVREYSQSGSATGIGAYPKPPPSFYDDQLKPREITFVAANAYERTTSWTYESFVEDDNGVSVGSIDPAVLDRPDSPEFYGDGEGGS